MNWSQWLRRIHRFMSVVFTLSVLVTFVALQRKPPVVWMSYVPLIPLAFLFFTGIYLFALPYLAKWRGARRGD